MFKAGDRVSVDTPGRYTYEGTVEEVDGHPLGTTWLLVRADPGQFPVDIRPAYWENARNCFSSLKPPPPSPPSS
jgi:hypothetical protein